jgi:hypothetical protein
MRDIGMARRTRSRPVTVDLVVLPSGLPNTFQGQSTDEGSSDCDTVVTSEPSQCLEPYGYYAVEPNARARELFHFSKKIPCSKY